MTYLEQLDLIVSQISYKPGWTIKLVDSMTAGPFDGWQTRYLALMITNHHAVDVGNPLQEIPLTRQLVINDPLTMLKEPDWFLHWIYENIRDFELHEVDEWLKFKGKCFRDPYPELKKMKIVALEEIQI